MRDNLSANGGHQPLVYVARGPSISCISYMQSHPESIVEGKIVAIRG